MSMALDHLIAAARTLEEGAAWVESRLGVPTSPGGKHLAMGTHNRLLSLGPGHYLEVIAIDPDAAPPGRPRWLAMDSPEMRERLEQGPALIHWVVRTDDIASAVNATALGRPEILSLSRGDYRWKIGVPPSGSLALDGIAPTVIEWQGKHPSQALPESGCRLELLVLRHPEAARMLHALREKGLSADDPVEAWGADHILRRAVDCPQGRGLQARIRTPRGIVELGNNSNS